MKGIYNVLDYEIVGDGVTNNTLKINNLVSMAKEGGVIFFPPGEYVTGTIKLKSNITLYICTGAILFGSENKDDFPFISESEISEYNSGGRHGIISAVKADNIIIEGGGIIDGRGYLWWNHKEDKKRPRTIAPILCNNVKIRNITIKNSPMWTVHPMCCTNVFIDGITISNPHDSPNTDGINPESCKNVHITNCIVDVGDDCITLKSGTENDRLQKQYACEDVVISNCTLLNGHGGIVIGSEMSGSVKNIMVSNCIFDGTDRGVRIKTRRKRGGIVENLVFCNLFMKDVFSPFTINEFYYCGADMNDEYLFSTVKRPIDALTPIIKNIEISNVIVKGANVAAMYIYGLPELPVSEVNVNNMSIECVKNDNVFIEPIMMPKMQKMSCAGVFINNLKNSCFNNIRVMNYQGKEISVDNADNVYYNGKALN